MNTSLSDTFSRSHDCLRHWQPSILRPGLFIAQRTRTKRDQRPDLNILYLEVVRLSTFCEEDHLFRSLSICAVADTPARRNFPSGDHAHRVARAAANPRLAKTSRSEATIPRCAYLGWMTSEPMVNSVNSVNTYSA
jgi:hypothetical protein